MLRPLEYLGGESHRGHLPAWSLGRLLEVMRMKASSQVVPLDDTFDRLIEGIEMRIKEGYFNKDYLEEKK